MNKASHKQYNLIDILKLTLALFVVLIHSGIDKTVISPLLRTAVPLFFIISSYLFFSKNQKLESENERKQALLKLVKRNLFLYLLWAIVQLPFWFFARQYNENGLLHGVWLSIRDLLLGNGFTGSWYIIALIIGMIVVFTASKKIPSKVLVLITLPIYVYCCLLTNYKNLFDAQSVICQIDNYYSLTGLVFYTSFPVAMFWVSLGKWISELKTIMKTQALLVVGGLAVVMLGCERFFVVYNQYGVIDDCYFMLIIVCPVAFLLVNKINFIFSTWVPVREWSTVLYVTHGCIGRAVGYMLKILPISNSIQSFLKIIITLLCSFLLCMVLKTIKESRHIKVLDYTY